ncbi:MULTISPECIES: universal stress protein [unclassified Kribbella]|uniref:universal stress protein n=1 Tax=unclassified Kribbella TaxID=2644121 RepID=UPI0030158B2F
MDVRDSVIVCGIDGSAAGQRAVEWAADEAERRGSRLRVVTVWSWDGLESGSSISSPAEARRRAGEIQSDSLNSLVARSLELAIERQVLEGRPSEQICEAALDADLIVLGSHGHGGFHDALVGSTSLHVIRHAPCPVVLLPDPRRAEREHKRFEHRRHLTRPQGASPMF